MVEGSCVITSRSDRSGVWAQYPFHSSYEIVVSMASQYKEEYLLRSTVQHGRHNIDSR